MELPGNSNWAFGSIRYSAQTILPGKLEDIQNDTSKGGYNENDNKALDQKQRALLRSEEKRLSTPMKCRTKDW